MKPPHARAIASITSNSKPSTTFTLKRTRQLEDLGVTGSFDSTHLRSIHRHLFQNVFPWAGDFRVVNIPKRNSTLGPALHIASRPKRSFGQAKIRIQPLQSQRLDLANRAAFYLGEINAIHPFREGNGRIQREFIRQLALSRRPPSLLGRVHAGRDDGSLDPLPHARRQHPPGCHPPHRALLHSHRMPMSSAAAAIPFSNTYARLPESFYARTNPTKVLSPRLLQLNPKLATFLNLDPAFLATEEGVAILSGNRIAGGSEPLAIAYAGHQFGHFVHALGDGRANLLGEVVARDGKRYDVQLKGSGPTPFSRRGDGRAALGPVLREYLLSESMAALGVPTTRALAAVATGEVVYRETPQPGAILTRVAASHLRVGTFQYFAARNDTGSLRTLADYAIARHYPEANSYRAFLEAVVIRQARLVAQWMLLGFIHGVMNTDNTSISGETIDYGPCAFMEAYHPHTVFSSIDQQGRYAYANQPNAMHWNLARLAETLLPLLSQETGSDESALASAYEALAIFAPTYDTARLAGLRRKLGLLTEQEGDLDLAEDLLTRMAPNRADFTLTFRRLCDASTNPDAAATLRTLFTDPSAFDSWSIRWHTRLQQEPASSEDRAKAMRSANPAVIPRNHHVAEVLTAAIDRNDQKPFQAMLEAVSNPFQDEPASTRYTVPAEPHEMVTQTFCGT